MAAKEKANKLTEWGEMYPEYIKQFFVYELSYHEIPFYVGLSAYPELRYSSHIYDSLSRCYRFLRFCIEYFGEYPEMNIVSCHPTKMKGLGAERERIEFRLQEGWGLLNTAKTNFPKTQLSSQIAIPATIMENINKQVNKYK